MIHSFVATIGIFSKMWYDSMLSQKNAHLTIVVYFSTLSYQELKRRRMLNAIALNKALEQVLGNGVECVVLVNTRGALLASASTSPSFRDSQQEAVLVAAAANLWRAYATCDLARNKSTGQVEPDSLEALLVELGESKICALGVGGAGILLLSGTQVELGMLKLKATSLQRHLDPSLRNAMT